MSTDKGSVQSESDLGDIDLDADGGIVDNEKTDRRQKMLLFGGLGVVVVLGSMYILDTGETVEEAMAETEQTTISTDALLNRERMDQEWVAGYEHQVTDQGKRLESVEGGMDKVRELEGQVAALQNQNESMARDGTAVFEAYERENANLRRQVEQARATPPRSAPAASAAAVGLTPTPEAGAAADNRPMAGRARDIKLVSFGEESGTGRRIRPEDGTTTYTDSPNFLPPNSMANAVVIVGADAATNTRSQSEPLPVLLRITGPARSVFGDGRLYATRVQGCMVNGAAYGDLSSEKVYVRLQRMTCPQPGGRVAVSEVKGFVAFGGKVGIRGRVISREGGLATQAFLAGLVGGLGNAFQGANQIPRITNDSAVLPSASDVGIQAIGGGAAQAGGTLSDYLIERAEQYQPVVEMPTGARVEVIFLDGTFVRN